ncbi:putative quinol monooxygenase [Actinoplanes sp. NPDC020271]|uniref:putative quinol monooxygenase n=1 Tax=Actinoplanes sp. NPDC020271 TaxID=3363896 RepID=UPI0037989906
MSAPAAGHDLMPTVPEHLPPGERPVLATLRARPGHETQLAAAISTLMASVRAEPGCLEFRSFHDAADPGAFYLYEIYADTEAFRTHLTLPHVARFFPEVERHSMTEPRALVQLVELEVGDPAGA